MWVKLNIYRPLWACIDTLICVDIFLICVDIFSIIHVRCDVSILTFQSRNTSRARIRTPARTATSMIHQGTPVCCATVRSGDTVNITWNHYPNKRKLRVKFIFGQQDPSKMCIKAGGFLKVQKKKQKLFLFYLFFSGVILTSVSGVLRIMFLAWLWRTSDALTTMSMCEREA